MWLPTLFTAAITMACSGSVESVPAPPAEQPTLDAAAPVDATPNEDAEPDVVTTDTGPDTQVDVSSDTGDAGLPFPVDEVQVSWVPCSLEVDANDGLAECATTEMPFDWRNDDGRTFDSYAKRLPSEGPAQAHLWLLHGGPGGSGTVGLPKMMQWIQEDYPELEVYTLDHRGTGYSRYLGCPEQEDPNSEQGPSITPGEMDACIAGLAQTYGNDIHTYNTTNSAIDLAAYLHATRQPGVPVFVWGGSGGTYWGQRYLQLFVGQVDGIILEGIVPPDFSIVVQDEYAEKIGRQIMAACATDPMCSSKVGPDPLGFLSALYAKLAQGHCNQLGITEELLRQTFSYLNFYHPYHTLMPALAYRLDRCTMDDMMALVQFYTVVFAQDDHPRSFSTVLGYNVITSELWEHHNWPSNQAMMDYVDGVHQDSVVAARRAEGLNDIFLKWNRYSDSLDDAWADTDVPMLMLQGQLDPSTPHDFAVTLRDQFTGQHQHFVTFPAGAHNVATGSPIDGQPDAMHCGKQLYIDFMKAPQSDLDTSCVANTAPLDFVGTPERATALFGEADLYENPPGSVQPFHNELPPERDWILQDLGRRLVEQGFRRPRLP